MIGKTERAVLDILRASLFGDAADLPEDTDTQAVLEELKAQTVTGICYDRMSREPNVDTAVKSKLHTQTVSCVAVYMRLMHEQDQLVRLMKSNGIGMAILKGSAAAMYYPKPELRAMGDVDFLVKPEDFSRAYRLMLDNGFELQYHEDHTDYHYTLKKNGIVFEMHKQVPGICGGEKGKYIESVIWDGMDQIETVKLEEYAFPVLPTFQNGLVLLLHIVSHLRSGLGLRQVVDWMMFVDRNLSDGIWETQFRTVLRRAGLEKLAICMTRTCQLYIGLRTEGISWCAQADAALCEELLGFFMSQGNFGRKIGDGDAGVKIISSSGSVTGFFRLLQSRGCNNWKAAQRFPFLRAFAWLYQMLKYIRIAVTRKHPLRSMEYELSESGKRGRLYDRLELFKGDG